MVQTSFSFSTISSFRNRLRKSQQPRQGQLVKLSDVPILSERRFGNLGDILDIDKGPADIARRQSHLATQDRIQEEAFAEVLREPACPEDGPVSSGLLDNLWIVVDNPPSHLHR